jgi:hypothetical protein
MTAIGTEMLSNFTMGEWLDQLQKRDAERMRRLEKEAKERKMSKLGWGYAPAEKYSKTEGNWILIVEGSDGSLLPATVPARYVSEAQAKAVAAIMAKKTPGHKFIIFQAVGEAIQPVEPAVVKMYG